MKFRSSALVAPFAGYLIPIIISCTIALSAAYVIFAIFKNRNYSQRKIVPELSIVDNTLKVPGATVVNLGFYLQDLWSIDTLENEFMAKFYLWARWNKSRVDEVDDEKNQIHQIRPKFDLANATDQDLKATFWEEKKSISTIELYDGITFHGKFHSQFDLSNYPFDTQTLEIILDESYWETDRIIFKPLPVEGNGFSSDIFLGSWALEKLILETKTVDYRTDWGGLSDKKMNSYARAVIKIIIKRISFPYVLKTLLPLFIMAIICGMVFYIFPDQLEVRSAISVTSILSIIALHITAGSGLPNIGYSTMMDKYFLLCYILALFATVETIINARILRINPRLAVRIDRYCGISYTIVVTAAFLTLLKR